MYFIYSLLLVLGFIILLPRFLFDAIRSGKYVAGFRERLGSLPPITSDRSVIWIHCVSVGETQAARPLVASLIQRFPDYSVAISTTTLTGQRLAQQVFQNEAATVFYFPFDWRWTVRRAFKAIKPRAVLIMETELWPNFLRECKQQEIPVAIVNGRLSQKSFSRYRRIKRFMCRVLSDVSLALMQSEDDAARLNSLGMDSRKTVVTGSLKFDVSTTTNDDSIVESLRLRFQLSPNTPIVLGASTHHPEEQILLAAFQQTSKADSRLILAPRHPERFDEVARLLADSGLKWSRRTAPPAINDAKSNVILLDTIGELQSVYRLASVVFVGGSVAKTGGHNIIEAAALGACIVTGFHTFNFQAIVEMFVKANAIIQLRDLDAKETTVELTNVFTRLLDNSEERRRLGERAKEIVELNRGATVRSLDAISDLLINSKEVRTATYLRAERAPTA